MASRGWEGVKASDLRQKGAPTAAKPSKYRNVRYEADGEKFDSKAEYATWHELKLREKAGEIRHLKRQVQIPLYAPVHAGAEATPRATALVAYYVADFTFEERQPDGSGEDWIPVVADRKGGRNTATFTLKKKWLFLQSGIEIRELR